MTSIKIENIIANTQIADALDVLLISEKIPDSNYNPSEFEGVSIKYDLPKTAVIILSNGKIVCTGAKSIEEVESTIKQTVKKIKDIGFELKKDYEIKTENVIVSTDFKMEMHLASIANALLLQHPEYYPELFPGLIYKIDDLCAVLILFSSGKLVCTGAKSIDDATSAVNIMEEKLESIGVL